MSKPYKDEELADQLSADLNWRLFEISDLKTAIIRADSRARDVLLRALVAICCAHWEGYVRFAAKKYLQHVSLRGFSYSKLDSQFLANLFVPRLGAFCVSKPSIADRCAVVEEIRNSDHKRYSKVNEDLINTKSNLNHDVFSDICLICRVDTNHFVGDRNFIDSMLLKRRNSIAHGENTMVDISELDDFVSQTIALMRKFGNCLENLASLKEYLA